MPRVPRPATLESIEGHAAEDLPPDVGDYVAEVFRVSVRYGHWAFAFGVHAHVEDATQWFAMQRPMEWRSAERRSLGARYTTCARHGQRTRAMYLRDIN